MLLTASSPLVSVQGPSVTVYEHTPRPAVRGVVVFLHGYGMHARMTRYAPLYAACACHALAVLAWDMPHHGASSDLGTPGHAWRHGRDLDAEALTADALALVARAHTHFPDVPFVLVGESMGGALATRIAPAVAPAALVCVAGAIPIPTRSRFFVWLRVNAALARAVARAERRGRATALKDPLVRARPVPPSAVRAGLQLLAATEPARVRAPILYVCGQRDPVFPWRDAKRALVSFAHAPRRVLRVIPDVAHDVLDAAVDDIVAFAHAA
tara:strand:+ start:430 stop:1236 length:807 start_codon:yes stop_codon:yes gene_type:complete